MGRRKCCVGGCPSTNETHKLFNIPKNDDLRALWMTFLIETNPLLSGLDREQLTSKRVCQLHFDRDQFDFKGRRLRYAYPCLFSENEIRHGIPLKSSDYPEHNYCTTKSPADTDEDCEMVVIGGDHTYSLPPQEPMEIEIKASPWDTTGKPTFSQSTSFGNMVVEPIGMDVTEILQNGKTVSKTMLTTAQAVGFFDALFDSVNGSKGCSTKGKLRGPIKSGSKHFVFWREAIEVLKSIKFIDSKSKRAKQAKKQLLVRVPSLEGWITTITSFERIAKELFDTFGIRYFYPRNINQDPLENFFGRIRALNYRNVNPDPYMFVNSFKSLLISNVMGPHSVYSNCEEDKGESIVDFFLLLKKKANRTNDKENVDPQHMTQESENRESLINNIIKEKMRVHSSAYTAGFLCRKLSKKFNCKECKKTYLSEDIENIHEMISHREYKGLKQRRLAYPSKALLIIYRDLANLIHSYLNNYAHLRKVMSNLKNIAYQQLNFEWLGCNKHHHDMKLYFVKSIMRLHIHNWCNIINKILRGALDEKYVCKMRGPQKLALLKYKAHRLRNKKKL